jgi:hypothetical protein
MDNIASNDYAIAGITRNGSEFKRIGGIAYRQGPGTTYLEWANDNVTNIYAVRAATGFSTNNVLQGDATGILTWIMGGVR